MYYLISLQLTKKLAYSLLFLHLICLGLTSFRFLSTFMYENFSLFVANYDIEVFVTFKILIRLFISLQFNSYVLFQLVLNFKSCFLYCKL